MEDQGDHPWYHRDLKVRHMSNFEVSVMSFCCKYKSLPMSSETYQNWRNILKIRCCAAQGLETHGSHVPAMCQSCRHCVCASALTAKSASLPSNQERFIKRSTVETRIPSTVLLHQKFDIFTRWMSRYKMCLYRKNTIVKKNHIIRLQQVQRWNR